MHAAARRGWRLNTPLGDDERGGSVIVDVPEGARVTDELLRRNVIVDYRPNAGIRIAPHFYNTDDEIDHAVSTIDEIVANPVAGR
jgi:kynureninase